MESALTAYHRMCYLWPMLLNSDFCSQPQYRIFTTDHIPHTQLVQEMLNLMPGLLRHVSKLSCTPLSHTMPIYNNILGTIGRTPVVRINRLAPAGINLFVKCEFFNPLSSVKDRLAIAVIEDAERKGLLKPGQTVVEATSGNTGIALAMVCAAKGYPFVATMTETFSVERRKIMRALGAKVYDQYYNGYGLIAQTSCTQ